MTASDRPAAGMRPWDADWWTPRRAFVAALAIAILYSTAAVFSRSVWTPDEPRVAGIGYEMYASGDYVVPTLGGKPFLEKPPLHWWVMTGMFRVFGVSDATARGTSVLAELLMLLIVYRLARRMASPLAGLTAVAVTASTLSFYRHADRIVVDPWLALFVLLGYAGFIVAAYPDRRDPTGDRPAQRAAAVLLIYISAGLAFLSKGVIGPALIAGPICVAALVGRRWDLARNWAHVPGIIIMAALCASWPMLLYQRGGRELLDEFMVVNILHRFVSDPELGAHKKPFLYYLTRAPQDLLPWLLAVPAVVHWVRQKAWPATWNGPALAFAACVFPVGVILLSIPGTKRLLYLLPIAAPFGIAVGAWLADTAWGGTRNRLDRFAHAGVLVVLVVLAAVGAVGSVIVRWSDTGSVGATPPGPATPAALAASVGPAVLLAAATIVCAVAGLRLWRRRSPAFGPVLVALSVLAFVLGGFLVHRAMDWHKSLHRMTADLVAMELLPDGLIAYRLDESTRGLIPFDTGVVLLELREPDDLARYVQKNPSIRILGMQKHLRELPDELRSQLRPVREWVFSSHRSYGLYEVSPTPQGENRTASDR